MKSDRRAATLIGVLYIIGTAAGVAGLAIMPSFAPGADILAQIAAHRSATVAGGYIIFRGALEGMIYILAAFIWLVLIALSAEPSAAAPVASALQAAEGLVWEQLIALPFVVGTLMFYGVLYRAHLVPRWLAIWGLVGAVLYVVAPLARMAGLDLDFLMFPLAIQEMVIAVWLIVKGFSLNPVDLAEDARAESGSSAGRGVGLRGTASAAGGAS